MEAFFIVGIVLIVLLLGGFFVYLLYLRSKESDFIENYKKINYGMSKEDVIELLGDGYTKSLLKGGVEKLEWRIDKSGATVRVASGVYMHSRGKVRKVTVKFQDNKVIELNALNME